MEKYHPSDRAGRPRRPLDARPRQEHREFFPFGITVSDEGQQGLTSADPGVGERPASQQVLDLLYEGAAASKSAYRAVGFVADVLLNGADAVRVETEHRDGGPALVVAMPYQFTGFRKKTLAYGQMTVAQGERRVWTD